MDLWKQQYRSAGRGVRRRHAVSVKSPASDHVISKKAKVHKSACEM